MHSPDCYSKLVFQKSKDFVNEFIFTEFQKYYDVSYIDDYLRQLHNDAVYEFNQLVDVFKDADHTNRKDVKYNHISKFLFESLKTNNASLKQIEFNI